VWKREIFKGFDLYKDVFGMDFLYGFEKNKLLKN